MANLINNIKKRYKNLISSFDDEISERDELLRLREEVIKMLSDYQYEEAEMLSLISELEERNDISEDERTMLRNYFTHMDSLSKVMDETRELLSDIENSVKEYIAFDKKLFFQNVRFLLSEQGIKIGELESKAGVRVGYMSRVEKPESSSEPSINFVATAAKMLNVSIDSLLYSSYVDMTETEKYIVSFLEKLISDTRVDKLGWNVESQSELEHIRISIDGGVSHPLFSPSYFLEDDGEPMPDYSNIIFNSHSFGDETKIIGDCYNAKIKGNTYLYIMYVTRNEFVKELKDGEYPFDFRKEIWMYKEGEKQFLCDSGYESNMKNIIEELYSAIEGSLKRPKISKDLRKDIDSFMNDEDDEDNGLPF